MHLMDAGHLSPTKNRTAGDRPLGLALSTRSGMVLSATANEVRKHMRLTPFETKLLWFAENGDSLTAFALHDTH